MSRVLRRRAEPVEAHSAVGLSAGASGWGVPGHELPDDAGVQTAVSSIPTRRRSGAVQGEAAQNVFPDSLCA